MRKNKLLLLLALLMTAVTGAWAQSTSTEVSTFADLQTALSAGNDVKLTANIQFTSSIEISGSKKITIDGNGKTMSGPSTRAFSISSGNTLAIKNATLDNFDLNAGGGAIRNNGTLVLDGCTVSNNHTDGSGQGGGAIENQGTLYASNTTFSGNYSNEIGGAINNYDGSLYLSGCTFTNNYTTASYANWGGAIGNNSSKTLVLVNCTFSGNKYGGSNGTASDLGVFSTPGTYTIAGCTGITIEGATLTTYQYGTATPDYSDLSNIKFDYQKSDTPIAAATTYTVSLADGVKDADKWTITPTEATTTGVAENTEVTLQYNGRLKVKGVKATSDAAPAEEPVTLATPLTVEAVTPGTIRVNIDGTLYSGMKYSVNGGTKTTITETTTIEGLKAGDKVQFYGNGTQTQAYGDSPEVRIEGSGDGFQTKAYGNIMSLLDEEGFATKTDLPNNTKFVFYGLFRGNSTLIDASELLLPATTLTEACYSSMFKGCTSLTTAPKLPATTLPANCYYGMFYGCTSLTSAYVKAAYIDDSNDSMFNDCTATGAVLHTAPGSKASWEFMMGTDKPWDNWTVAGDWEE